MTSTARFILVCAIWVLAFPFLVGLVFGAGGYGTLLTIAAIGATSLLAAPLWIATAMNNRSRWDLVARYVAVLLLLAGCMVAIGGVEILVFRSNTTGGWH
jgi:hypothetical protein